MLDAADHLVREEERLLGRVLVEAPVAAADAVDGGSAVQVGERLRRLPDDVVQPGAEAAARDDRRAHLCRIEVQRLARPRAPVNGETGPMPCLRTMSPRMTS